MPRVRSDLEFAAGKLIASIQRAWTAEAGEPEAEESEAVMDRAHLLLQGAKTAELQSVLEGRTISECLGQQWLRVHPQVQAYVQARASPGKVSA